MNSGWPLFFKICLFVKCFHFRRDDFSHRLDSRSSPDRRNRFQTQAPFSSVRSRVENRGTDRFSDKYDVPKPSWPPVDNSWVSSGDRWQSSSYGIQSRMMPNSLDSLSRPDSTFAPRSSYFSGNNRRYWRLESLQTATICITCQIGTHFLTKCMISLKFLEWATRNIFLVTKTRCQKNLFGSLVLSG